MGVVTVWVVLVLGTGGLAGAEEPLRWTLDDVLAMSLEEHPALRAARERIDAAEGVVMDAGRWQNPHFMFSGENYPLDGRSFDFSNEMEWFVYVTQTFDTAGKKGHRREIAAMGKEIAELDYELTRLEVADSVKRAYEDAVSAGARLELARDTFDRLEQLAELNRVRSVEGYIAEGDFIRTKLESERFGFAAGRAELSFRRAQIALLQAMGRGAFDVRFELEAEQPVASVLDRAALRDAALARPEVRLMEAAITRAEAVLALERSTASPDVSASFGYKRNGPDNALYGALSVPLPLFDRNQGGVHSARAELAAAGAELELRRSRVLGELEAALSAVEATRRQVESLRTDFIERADESRGIALAAYREGSASLLLVIEAERARNGAQELFVEAMNDHRLAIHELERAAGRMSLPLAGVAAEDSP